MIDALLLIRGLKEKIARDPALSFSARFKGLHILSRTMIHIEYPRAVSSLKSSIPFSGLAEFLDKAPSI